MLLYCADLERVNLHVNKRLARMHACVGTDLPCVCVCVYVCMHVCMCRCTFQDNAECGICAQNEAVVYINNRMGTDADQVSRKARMEPFMPKSEFGQELQQSADGVKNDRDGIDDGTRANACTYGEQQQQQHGEDMHTRPHSAHQPPMELEDLTSEAGGKHRASTGVGERKQGAPERSGGGSPTAPLRRANLILCKKFFRNVFDDVAEVS